ncbi:MAG TPA: response regulator [Planctomycetota bacterium]|nr:response regulator [Planctomycetota bacterium]
MAAKDPRARILVADDDGSLRGFLKTALGHLGYAVTLCRNGATALQRSRSGGYDLLLLDFRMGSPTGFEVLRSLRSRGIEVPVVIMSSDLPEETLAACAGIPNVSLLHKPFSLNVLRKTLLRHLPHR